MRLRLSPIAGCSQRRRGSAFVEVLVVIAIIMLFLALFVPALAVARRASRKVQCFNQLKQVSVAMQNYHDSEGCFPPGWSSNAQGAPGWGWMPRLMPYSEQAMLAQSLGTQESIASAINSGQLINVLPTLLCPADTALESNPMVDVEVKSGSLPAKTLTAAASSYLGCFGSRSFDDCLAIAPDSNCIGDGVFYRNSFLKLTHLDDGATHTLMVSERRSDHFGGIWGGAVPGSKNSPGRVVGHAGEPPNTMKSPTSFSSFHPGGVNAMFADGGVRSISDQVDPAVFRAIATRDGNELRVDYDAETR